MRKTKPSIERQRAESTAVLATWAQLASLQPTISWVPVSSLIDTVERESEAAELSLNYLLDRADESFRPLADPLRANVVLHRWLSKEREEAYSDWLAWTLERLRRADLVLRVLGFTQSDLFASIANEVVTVVREKHIATGRLDLDIRFGHKAMLVVEVKKSLGEDAVTAKQVGYDAWIDRECQIHNLVKIPPRLLVVDDSEEVRHGFTRLRWADVCIELRTAVSDLLAHGHETTRGAVIEAAMMAAFIAAIEQNLLHFRSPSTVLTDADRLLFGSTCAHLQRFIRRLKHNGGTT